MSGTRRMFAPRAQTTDKRFYGVVEAIVMDALDPEKEGRVKVQFPWFDDDMVTEWCRVSQLYAGNGYGSLFVPEVGDEVLVAFVHGDMRMPVVLGGLYNGNDKPSSARERNKDQKLIRTKGGHELVFDDTKNTVTLTTSGGQSLLLDVTAGKVTVTGATIVLDGSSVQVGGSSASVKVGGLAAALTPMLAEMFLPLFASHVHTVGVVPTSPPVPAPPLTPQLTGSSTVKLTA